MPKKNRKPIDLLDYVLNNLKFQDRFIAKTKIDSWDGCWVWTGYTKPDGRARVRVGPSVEYASRVAWMIRHKRYIPEGLLVCHKCDNPLCVREDHLFLGTHKDNSEDMVRKGRSAKGLRNGIHTHPTERGMDGKFRKKRK